MTPNQKLVFEKLQPLQGKIFSDREALEDALFPYYGALQPIFHGEGHRDLVDRLIAAKWISIDAKGQHCIILNGLPNMPFTAASESAFATPAELQTSLEINYSELQTLLLIGNAPNGMVPTSSFIMNEALINNLIQKDLVQLSEDISPADRLFNDTAVKTAVTRAKVDIDNGYFYEAIGALETAAKYSEKNAKAQSVYSLTTKGQGVRQKLQSVTIKI